ncbi:MAG: PilZ domain-containing protein [Deltaproteobacteria bacterium]|nr:PilZ domain-containing protein [Deltaproteobacteria bacterium]
MSTVIGGAKKARPRTERRKSRRKIVFTKYPVVVHTKDTWNQDHAPIAAIVTDISNSGLGLIAQGQLKRGSAVLIVMQAGTAYERELEGEVIWMTSLPSCGRILKPNLPSLVTYWRIGVRLDPDDKEQCEFIEGLLKK